MGWLNFVYLSRLGWVRFVLYRVFSCPVRRSRTFEPKKTHLPGTFPAVGPWASVLRLDCYIRSAPEDTHAPRIQHVQASARFCASKLCAYLHTRSDFRSRDF